MWINAGQVNWCCVFMLSRRDGVGSEVTHSSKTKYILTRIMMLPSKKYIYACTILNHYPTLRACIAYFRWINNKNKKLCNIILKYGNNIFKYGRMGGFLLSTVLEKNGWHIFHVNWLNWPKVYAYFLRQNLPVRRFGMRTRIYVVAGSIVFFSLLVLHCFDFLC